MELLLNAAQMKQYDRDTIDKIGIPSMVLMERAALCFVEELARHAFDLSSVLILCGSGNNGGDGFAIARLLSEKGVTVRTAFVGKDSSMTEETAMQRRICENYGIKICTDFQAFEYTTIVDAIFGIGLSRPVEGHYAELITWVNEQKAVKAAVDIPSGISADSGKILGTAVKADLTVTFACRKIGQILYPGAEYCGEVICRNIGILPERLPASNVSADVFTYEKSDLHNLIQRTPYSNKGTYGKVLLIAGSQGMSGAACLAATAAYRSGCGLVRVFTPDCNRQILQTVLPEAIVTAYSEQEIPLTLLRQSMEWADVIGIGPGLGTAQTAQRILETVLRESKKPMVIDADGLNLLSVQPALLHFAKAPVILTPHIGEMMRLTERQKSDITEDIIFAASSYAKKYGIICVLKDARTVVSDGQKNYLNTSGNHGMAVGGSGDVLTGIICGLLAQGMDPFHGAALGVYLHGLAGDLARKKLSAYSMIAGDILNQLGQVLKEAEKMPCGISGGIYET